MTAPPTPASAPPRTRLIPLAIFLCALAAPLLYTLYTHHVWEDSLVALRYSQNLAEGRGLTYNPPERIYGFTSPLGVLLPALFQYLIHPADAQVTLNCFRLTTALAFAAAVTLVFTALRRGLSSLPPLPSSLLRLAPALTAALILLEPKSIAYAANGMETAFMILGVALCLRLSLHAPSTRWTSWALTLAFIEWTRPDGFIFAAAALLANLAFNLEPRKAILKSFIKSAALALALYAPWLLFATAYYGSPIPQTMIAKAVHGAVHGGSPLFTRAFNFPNRIASPFQAIYFQLGGWPAHVYYTALALGLIAAFAWLIRPAPRMIRLASLTFLLTSFYFCFLVIDAPWYYPPFTLSGLAVVAPLVLWAADRISSPFPVHHSSSAPRRPMSGVRCSAFALLALILAERALYTADFANQIRAQQSIVENGNRTRIGLFLRDHVKPNETVYLEPLGYIGYYSGAHMVDFPGLVSPQVTEIIRQKSAGLLGVAATLRPDWLVLRKPESDFMQQYTTLPRAYAPVASFDVTPRATATHVDGLPYLLVDSAYTLYHRRD